MEGDAMTMVAVAAVAMETVAMKKVTMETVVIQTVAMETVAIETVVIATVATPPPLPSRSPHIPLLSHLLPPLHSFSRFFYTAAARSFYNIEGYLLI